MRILAQRHSWAIFFSKMSKEKLLQSMAIVIVICGNIWFRQDGATAEVTLDVLRPVFEDRIISRRANVVWPPRSCDLTPLL